MLGVALHAMHVQGVHVLNHQHARFFDVLDDAKTRSVYQDLRLLEDAVFQERIEALSEAIKARTGMQYVYEYLLHAYAEAMMSAGILRESCEELGVGAGEGRDDGGGQKGGRPGASDASTSTATAPSPLGDEPLLDLADLRSAAAGDSLARGRFVRPRVIVPPAADAEAELDRALAECHALRQELETVRGDLVFGRVSPRVVEVRRLWEPAGESGDAEVKINGEGEAKADKEEPRTHPQGDSPTDRPGGGAAAQSSSLAHPQASAQPDERRWAAPFQSAPPHTGATRPGRRKARKAQIYSPVVEEVELADSRAICVVYRGVDALLSSPGYSPAHSPTRSSPYSPNSPHSPSSAHSPARARPAAGGAGPGGSNAPAGPAGSRRRMTVSERYSAQHIRLAAEVARLQGWAAEGPGGAGALPPPPSGRGGAVKKRPAGEKALRPPSRGSIPNVPAVPSADARTADFLSEQLYQAQQTVLELREENRHLRKQLASLERLAEGLQQGSR